ncbi:hypothetical protein BV510_22340, partial [Mycolicibacterium diernhoferi]
RTAVERYVSPRVAHMLETIWDGSTVHRVLNGTELDDAGLRELLKATLALDPARGYPRRQEAAKPAKKPTKKAATRRKAS